MVIRSIEKRREVRKEERPLLYLPKACDDR
jgi:hypothetical protein